MVTTTRKWFGYHKLLQRLGQPRKLSDRTRTSYAPKLRTQAQTGINRRRTITLLLLLCGTFGELRGACTNDQFDKLYDVYFPKRSSYADSEYRKYFDMILFGPPLARPYRKRDRTFYYAFRGDRRALRDFLHDSDRGVAGEFGEFWAQECLLLLLRWGDECFAERLAEEAKDVRESVGQAVDGQISWGWNRHPFPKTRALYSYRWQPPSRDPLLKNN